MEAATEYRKVTLGLVVRVDPDNVKDLLNAIRDAGGDVRYAKQSAMRLVLEEVPW